MVFAAHLYNNQNIKHAWVKTTAQRSESPTSMWLSKAKNTHIKKPLAAVIRTCSRQPYCFSKYFLGHCLWRIFILDLF